MMETTESCTFSTASVTSLVTSSFTLDTWVCPLESWTPLLVVVSGVEVKDEPIARYRPPKVNNPPTIPPKIPIPNRFNKPGEVFLPGVTYFLAITISPLMNNSL